MEKRLLADFIISMGFASLIFAFYYDWKHQHQEMAGKTVREKIKVALNVFHPSRDYRKSIFFGCLFVVCLSVYLVMTPA